MDIKDVKVGMLVQLNPNYTGNMFPALRYMQETGEPLEVVSVTHEYIRVRYKGSALGFYPAAFKPYQDPEADMIVWDALEVGEHFIVTTGQEAVKISEIHYIVLNLPSIYTVLQSRLGKLEKLKLA